MTHTAFIESNLLVSSAVVNPLLSIMSKRAGGSFATAASAKQKPVHCTAMIARKINGKNAGMGHHALSAPDYKAGGDTKREDLCQQDPQQFKKNGCWSIMKLRATGSYVTQWWRESSPSGKHWWRNLHQVIRWSCKEFNATGRGGARVLQAKYWTVFVPDLVKIPPTFKISRSTLRFGDKFTSDCLWASSWLTKGSFRVHQRMPMNIFSSTQDVRQSLQR